MQSSGLDQTTWAKVQPELEMPSMTPKLGGHKPGRWDAVGSRHLYYTDLVSFCLYHRPDWL